MNDYVSSYKQMDNLMERNNDEYSEVSINYN